MRACALLASRIGVVQDRLTGVKPGAKVRWAMVTRARSCKAQGNDMMLATGKKRLTVRAVLPTAVTWQVLDLSTPPNTWDSANEGASMIAFEAVVPESGAVDFRVMLVPGGVQPGQAIPDFIATGKK